MHIPGKGLPSYLYISYHLLLLTWGHCSANFPTSIPPAPIRSINHTIYSHLKQKTLTLLLPSATTSFLSFLLAKLLERGFYTCSLQVLFSHPLNNTNQTNIPLKLLSLLLSNNPHIAKTKGRFLALISFGMPKTSDQTHYSLLHLLGLQDTIFSWFFSYFSGCACSFTSSTSKHWGVPQLRPQTYSLFYL